MKNKILVVSGPTGSGESTITKEIIKRYPIFQRLVTSTTRKPRGNEQDRVDYYFFTEEEFKKQRKQGNIIEYTFIENRGVYYGTYRLDLEKKIKQGHVIVNVDHVGLKYYQKNYKAISIFINVQSLEVIKDRLKKRNPEMTEEELNQRLKNAQDEIDREEKFYDYVVINKQDKLEEALREIEEILKKENYITRFNK
jgi:guanylate kinase